VGPGDVATLFDEHPVKAHDHALDALRYALHSHFGAERLARVAAHFIGQLQRRMEAAEDPPRANTQTLKAHDGQEQRDGDSG